MAWHDRWSLAGVFESGPRSFGGVLMAIGALATRLEAMLMAIGAILIAISASSMVIRDLLIAMGALPTRLGGLLTAMGALPTRLDGLPKRCFGGWNGLITVESGPRTMRTPLWRAVPPKTPT